MTDFFEAFDKAYQAVPARVREPLEAAGFAFQHTGGGCLAFERVLDDPDCQLLLTDTSGVAAPASLDGRDCLFGCHGAEGGLVFTVLACRPADLIDRLDTVLGAVRAQLARGAEAAEFPSLAHLMAGRRYVPASLPSEDWTLAAGLADDLLRDLLADATFRTSAELTDFENVHELFGLPTLARPDHPVHARPYAEAGRLTDRGKAVIDEASAAAFGALTTWHLPSFERFRATRAWVGPLDDGLEGYAYAGTERAVQQTGDIHEGLTVTYHPTAAGQIPAGHYHLVIGPCEWVGADIRPLEWELYKFACAEGYLDREATAA